MRKFLLLGIFVLGTGLVGKGQARSQVPSLEAAEKSEKAKETEKKSETEGERRIGAGDRLRVKIYPEDEYIKGGETEVSSEGTITLSLIGKIPVEGMKVIDAERKIVEVLTEDYLVNPVVVIERVGQGEEKETRSLAILGQVQKPGSYDFPTEGKLTLLRVISMAGGFTDIANAKKIKVIRKQGGKTQVIRANAEAIISGKDSDLELEPNDVIHVGESFF